MSSILSTVVRSVVDKVLETMFDDFISAVKGGVVVKYAVKILNTYISATISCLLEKLLEALYKAFMSTSDDSMVQKARAKVLNYVEMMLDKSTTVADGVLDKENRAEILKVAEIMLDLLTSLAVKGAVDKVLENIFDESTTAADGSLDKKSKAKKSNGIADILINKSTTVADGILDKENRAEILKVAEIMLDLLPSLAVKGAVDKVLENIFDESTTSVARSVVEKILAIASDESRKRNEEETTKAVESRTDETSQELIKTMKALQEYLKESKESGQRECQHSRAQPEENQGQNEGENSSAMTIRNFQQLSQIIESLEERFQQMVESS